MDIDFLKYENELTNLRREFHKIPEMAFCEFETSKKIKEYLVNLGISDIKEYTKTGLSATIYGGGDKTIALRADIDALPVNEENDIDYKSVNSGKMHACGHDGHIAMNLIVAKIFSENKNLLKGNLKLIFQPAEEGVGGAKPMIKEGVLQNPDVNYVIGGHLWPEISTGKIGVTYNASFAASSVIDITVNGKGGHAAIPSKIKDAVYAASEIIINLKKLGQRFNDLGKTNVLSMTSFDSVSAYNIYRDNAYLKGTLRTLDEKTQNELEKEIKKCVSDILAKNNVGGKCEIKREYPALINDKNILSAMENTVKDVLGEDAVTIVEPTMGAEDFAYFAQKVPSAHIKIGTKINGYDYPLHHAKYNINEKSLIIGVKVFASSIINILNR